MQTIISKKYYILFSISIAFLAAMRFPVSAFAKGATTTSFADSAIGAATTTIIISAPSADTSSSTVSFSSISTDAALPPPSLLSPVSESAPPPPSVSEPVVPSAPNPQSAPSAPASPPPPSVQEPPVLPPPPPQEPSPPPVQPVIPFQSTNGRAFDAATAPSKVRLKILNPDSSAPSVPVFVTFVGVGGRTYGGPVDREGNLETTMPTGRYYADILVIDTKSGPPSNPPSFFLDANENRDLGVLILSDKSSFADPSLEQEVASALGDKESARGFAKIFALIVNLLLAILKEIRGIRSELLGR